MNDAIELLQIAFVVWTNVYHLIKYKIYEIKSLLCKSYGRGNKSYFCDYQAASAVA